MSWWRSGRCERCKNMAAELLRVKSLLSDVSHVFEPLRPLMNERGLDVLARVNKSAYGAVYKESEGGGV